MATTKKVPTATPVKASKKTNISKLSHSELIKQADALKQDIITLKRNMKTGDVQNVRAHIAKRRELARLLTAINAPQAKEEEK